MKTIKIYHNGKRIEDIYTNNTDFEVKVWKFKKQAIVIIQDLTATIGIFVLTYLAFAIL